MLSKNLFIISLSLLMLGQFSSVFKNTGVNLYLFDIFVGLFALLGLMHFLLFKKKFFLPDSWIFFGSFILIALASFIFNFCKYDFRESFVAFSYFLRLCFYLISSLNIYNYVRQKEWDISFVLNAFIISGVVLSIGGFIQMYFLPDFSVLDPSLGWDPHKNRLASSFFDPNFAAMYLGILLVILIDILTKRKSNWYLFSFVIILFAFFLTFSRSGWAFFGVSIMVFGLFRAPKLLISSIIIFLCVLFAVPRIQTRLTGITDPSDSASLRLVSWEKTLDVIEDNALIGVGYNYLRYYQSDAGLLESDSFFDHSSSGSDSSFLYVFATTGVLGFILFLSGFIFLIYQSVIKNNLVILSIILGILVESLFINSIFYPQIMFLLFTVLFMNFSFDK